MTSEPPGVTASAPGKVILFGEHAVNRGQPALAAAVGLRARCRIVPNGTRQYRFRAGSNQHLASPDALRDLACSVDGYRASGDYEAIRALARSDYFAPQKYILATVLAPAAPQHATPNTQHPHGFDLSWESEVPSSSGLGSGGAAFTAMVAALADFLPRRPEKAQRAAWAHLGDIIAHGGVASMLDTQTSLFGGVIRFTGKGLARRVRCAPGLMLVVGHTGVAAATSEVNTRVRRWYEESPDSRIAYFRMIGELSRAALPVLERGDWPELGRLFNTCQHVLEQIGVSCPEGDALIRAAREAGAYGAKMSGSGGGGIIIALVSPETREAVAAAIQAAGGTALTPEIGVEGARIET